MLSINNKEENQTMYQIKHHQEGSISKRKSLNIQIENKINIPKLLNPVMKMPVYINKLNSRVIKDKQDDHHDNVVKYWKDFLLLQHCVENEAKF